MAFAGNRIPAWRRLGLSLKNEDQSGVSVSDLHTVAHVLRDGTVSQLPEDNHENSQSPSQPAVNGKPSKLGKRKHQPGPADEDSQEPKRGKTTGATEHNGNADYQTAQVMDVDSENTDLATVDAPSTEKAQPKGDPNYRKKKVKPNKRARESHGTANAESAPARSQPAYEVANLSPTRADSTTVPATLLVSTETADLALNTTPQTQLKARKSSKKNPSGTPSPQPDRRKSVAFTPDTKTSDGNSGQELFKKWVAEQKGTGAVSAPPEVSDFILHSLIAAEEKTARKNGQLEKRPTTTDSSKGKDSLVSNSPATVNQSALITHQDSAAPAISNKAKGRKKDPSIYIAYLSQYYNDRNHWKFNKAKQNDVVDNALNIFRIPSEHSDALIDYVAGLQGAGVIERLRGRCHAALKELDEQDAQNPIEMDDAEARRIAQEEAQSERIANERKRRNTEGDVENFTQHPHGDGYIRRLRRSRAEALLTALGRTAPILPAVAQTNGFNPMLKSIAPQKRESQKRKRRGEVSSDDSSSDESSSEDSSSSESESDDSDGSKSESSSDSSDEDEASSSDDSDTSSSDDSD